MFFNILFIICFLLHNSNVKDGFCIHYTFSFNIQSEENLKQVHRKVLEFFCHSAFLPPQEFLALDMNPWEWKGFSIDPLGEINNILFFI